MQHQQKIQAFYYQILINNKAIILLIMQRQVFNNLPDYPASPTHNLIKIVLNSLITKLQNLQKEKGLYNRMNYLQLFKQMSWTLSKCTPNWPTQIQEMAVRLNGELSNFQTKLVNIPSQKSRGFPFCGSSSKPRQQIFQIIYKRILGYQHIFSIIGIYQDRKLKQDLIEKIITAIENTNRLEQKQKILYPTEKNISRYIQQPKQLKIRESRNENHLNCRYCELYKAASVCPNGFIVKKMLNQLQDVEWFAGILYQDGKIIDKNLNKAIQFYQAGRRKNNPQATYRLGLLSQRGQYGKPLQYLKLWEEAAGMGHLQSLTDLGYLYQNGLEQFGKSIVIQNPQKALQYYSKAAQKNFPRALNNLASFYFSNKKYKNLKKCLEYFERGVEAEYVKSLYNLGIIYLQGQIGSPNPQKAQKLIKRSAQKGDIQGKQQYVQIMLNDIQRCSDQDFNLMNTYCRQIIAQQEDNCYAYYFLGIMHEGGFGFQKQPKTALLYYTKAAQYKCPEAQIKIGDCYRNGLGVEHSSRQAIKYYQKAAQSLPQANIAIGQMYEKGCQDLKQNFQTAFNHYYIACNHQVADGFIHIGNMYRYGRHVKKDEGKAQEYYNRAKNYQRKTFNQLSTSSELIQSSYHRARK